MSDNPERIWACMQGPMVGLFVSGGPTAGWPEYVRADLIEAQAVEIERLREALAFYANGMEPFGNTARSALENKS